MEAFNKVKPKKIKIADYEMDRTLGSGSFGHVKLRRNICSNKNIKKIRINKTQASRPHSK